MEEVAYNSGPDKAKVQSVLLLTDGLANQGVTTKDGILAEMMRIQNPQGEKIAQKVCPVWHSVHLIETHYAHLRNCIQWYVH